MDIVGLIPAGGVASRLGKLPCSKEILPVMAEGGKVSVITSNLIRYYQVAGIRNIYCIIRKGKWDIPEYFGDGSEFGINIGYLVMNLPYGTPFTLNQAYPFIKGKMVALGFPDILFEPEDAFLHLRSRLTGKNGDIVLGVVPCSHYLRSDMLEFDEKGNIRDIVIKQKRPDLKYSWFIALWRPSFTVFMNDFLKEFLVANPEGKIRLSDGSAREMYVGDVIQAAIVKGLQADYVLFESGHYLDIGTPQELKNWIKDT
jgi:glucose-1-phosphate thymidylyltransferase